MQGLTWRHARALACQSVTAEFASGRKSILRGSGRGHEIRRGFWLGGRHRDLLYQQPLDSLGDHPRHSGLALRDLCRTVWVIRATASVARMERSEIRGHIRRIAIPDLWRQ